MSAIENTPLIQSRSDSVPTGDALVADNGEFAKKFNVIDFQFDHGLAHHPLFEVSALAQLARRIPKYRDFVFWQNGRIKVDDKWESNPATRLSLEETIDGIAHNDSLVVLKHAEQDPVYGPLLQEILQRIYSFMSPEARSDIVLGESLIFMNSPGRKTAYHMDLESNFLLQIQGVKHVRVFDCNDRTLVTDEELENHCGGDHNAAKYKPDRDGDAHRYVLTPGHGLHFPSTAPHWVQNGDTLSISININYDTISVHQRKQRIYRVNRMMRRWGLKPRSPGLSPWRDNLKKTAAVGAAALLRTLRPAKPKDAEADAYPIWRPTPVTDSKAAGFPPAPRSRSSSATKR